MFGEFFEVAIVLFLIMDPIANVFTINSFLKNFEPRIRAKIILRELWFSLIILVFSLVVGLFIFEYINFSTNALNSTGGVLLLFISYKMYFQSTRESKFSFSVDPVIFPIAFPLIAGPSVISILLILSSRNPDKIIHWISAVFVSWAVVAVILIFSPYFVSRIKKEKLRFIEKSIAVILVILALRLIKMGFQDF